MRCLACGDDIPDTPIATKKHAAVCLGVKTAGLAQHDGAQFIIPRHLCPEEAKYLEGRTAVLRVIGKVTGEGIVVQEIRWFDR